MRRVPPALAAVAAGASLALASVAPAAASVTLWPTCSSPPGGDYARCVTGAFPQSVAAGPDGAVWFTELRGQRLGRLRDGTITEFPLPRSDARPFGIAVDGSGNVWFTDLSGGLGRLSAERARGR